MAQAPLPGTFLYGHQTNTATGPILEDWLTYTKQLLGGIPEATKVIASGLVTPDRSMIAVDTEGSASTDNLDLISASILPTGSLLLLQMADASRQVVVRHAQGTSEQIFLRTGADGNTGFTFKSTSQFLLLRREGTQWLEILRWYGNQTADWRAFWGLSAAATYQAASQAEVLAATATDRLVTPARLLDFARGTVLFSGSSGLARSRASSVVSTDDLLVWTSAGVQLANRDVVLGGPNGAPKRYVELGEFAITGGAQVSANHGLGGTPTDVIGYLRCKTADASFDNVSEVPLQSLVRGGNLRAATLWANPTQAGANFLNTSAPLGVIDGSGTAVDITPASWRLVIRCRRQT